MIKDYNRWCMWHFSEVAAKAKLKDTSLAVTHLFRENNAERHYMRGPKCTITWTMRRALIYDLHQWAF